MADEKLNQTMDGSSSDAGVNQPEAVAVDPIAVSDKAEPADKDVQVSNDSGGQEVSDDEAEELRANEVAFEWQASEYVLHHKNTSWYLALAAGVIVLSAIAALMQYYLEIGALVVMGVAVAVYAGRPPRTLTYGLTPNGITLDGKDIPFTEFRSFGVISDEDWHTIDLVPTKRFSPRVGVLFEEADFDTIIGHLELHLPRVDRDPDIVERLTRILRF